MAILCFCCVYVCLGLWYIDIILYIFVIIQQELIGLNARIQGSIEDRERVIQSLPQVSQAHKVKTSLNNHVRSIAAVCWTRDGLCVPQVSLQQLIEDSQAVFVDVLRSVELSRSQVLELLHTHESSSSTHVQAHTHQIQQEILLLRQKQEQLRRLERIEDPVTFLNVSAQIRLQ